MLPTIWTCTILLLGAATARTTDIRFGDLELTEVGTDHIRAGFEISVTTKTPAVLRSIVFDRVTVNGVAVTIPPVRGPIRLRQDQPAEGLTELNAVLSYRDLETLWPLRQIVDQGKARVRAVVRAELELSLFQKLVLLTRGAWVVTEVDQEIPVEVPGGMLGRLAALAALTAAEPVWITGQGGMEWRRSRSEVAQTARQTAMPALVALESRYELKSRNGESVTVRSGFVGFHVGNGRIVAPAEALSPWSFDAAIAEALEKRDVVLNEKQFEIIASPAGKGETYSLRRKQVRIAKELRGAAVAISMETKRAYRLRFRNSDENVALLEIREWRGEGSSLRAAPKVGEGWHPAVVFRMQTDPAGRVEPVLWTTEVRRENGRYRIRDPIAETVFGSPVWVNGGVAAVLLDANTAADFEDVLKRLM